VFPVNNGQAVEGATVPGPEDDLTDQQFAPIVKRLDGRFGDVLGHDTVERTVRATWQQYAAATVRTFVPMLVEKDAFDVLRRLTV